MPPGRKNKKRVLIVEDDPGIGELISLALGESYAVEVCPNGKTLKRIVSARTPDLILLDLRVPGLDCKEFMRWLKVTEKAAHIPVVVISALNNLNTITEEIGAEEFIAKPFDIDALRGVVEKYTNQKQGLLI